jgi:peptidoglycan hydrolase-like protein with peptidoglycan-binding domain
MTDNAPDPTTGPNRNRTIAFVVLGALAVILLVAGTVAVVTSGEDTPSPTTGVASTTSPTTTDTGGSTTTGGGTGDLSGAVQQIQTGLSILGFYEGDIDGIYGPATETAVQEFQESQGFPADGIYGPLTDAALREALGEAAPGVIAELQQILADLGLYAGLIDGVYGPATEEAVRRLQESCGITADGRYGPQTHQCLLNSI